MPEQEPEVPVVVVSRRLGVARNSASGWIAPNGLPGHSAGWLWEPKLGDVGRLGLAGTAQNATARSHSGGGRKR